MRAFQDTHLTPLSTVFFTASLHGNFFCSTMYEISWKEISEPRMELRMEPLERVEGSRSRIMSTPELSMEEEESRPGWRTMTDAAKEREVLVSTNKNQSDNK